MSSLELVQDNLWKALAPQAQGALYRKCQNYYQENVCNWMIEQQWHADLCISCDLNDIIPDLSIPENKIYWQRLEIAKRRLVYSLLRLGLPLRNKDEDPQNGLAFSFMADDKKRFLRETKRVLTGHDQGKITLNIAEANDLVREKMRLNMNERYRTLLGHFRHEIGHYYWFLLIENNVDMLSQFRNLFGDETQDYNKTLKHYYKTGAPADWQERFVSAYASAHPWEDWAESWAHFLHMSDTLETARSWNLIAAPYNGLCFDEMKSQWIHVGSALNSLNRSMGMKDVYPFAWSEAVIEKLRFVHQFIMRFSGKEGL